MDVEGFTCLDEGLGSRNSAEFIIQEMWRFNKIYTR